MHGIYMVFSIFLKTDKNLLSSKTNQQKTFLSRTLRKHCKYHVKWPIQNFSRRSWRAQGAPKPPNCCSHAGEMLAGKKSSEHSRRCLRAPELACKTTPEVSFESSRGARRPLASTKRVVSKSTCVACRREHFWAPEGARKNVRKHEK